MFIKIHNVYHHFSVNLRAEYQSNGPDFLEHFFNIVIGEAFTAGQNFQPDCGRVAVQTPEIIGVNNQQDEQRFGAERGKFVPFD